MGAYTNIKGWIELPEGFASQAKAILRKYRAQEYLNKFSVKEHQAELYSIGWVMQESSINGYQHVFYGAEIRTYLIDYIKAQVQEIALLSTQFDDDLLQPEGFFYLEEDGTHDYPEQKWIVAEGKIVIKESKI